MLTLPILNDPFSNTQEENHSDPIIQKLLANRQCMTDVSEAEELERQKRMYVMLRHSRKYKKLQVEQANDLWEKHSSLANLSDILQGLPEDCLLSSSVPSSCSSGDEGIVDLTLDNNFSLDSASFSYKKKVSFREAVDIIEISHYQDRSESLSAKLKNIFKRR